MAQTVVYIAVASGLLVACATDGDPGDDFFADGKADAFSSSQIEVDGTLEYGNARSVAYANPPRYRAVQFDGIEDDETSFEVTSASGTPRAWLLDPALHVIGTGTRFDAKLAATGKHLIVIREQRLQAATMTITLWAKPDYAGLCFQKGRTYEEARGDAICPPGQLCTPWDNNEEVYGCQATQNLRTCTTDADCGGDFCDAVAEPGAAHTGTVSQTTRICVGPG